MSTEDLHAITLEDTLDHTLEDDATHLELIVDQLVGGLGRHRLFRHFELPTAISYIATGQPPSRNQTVPTHPTRLTSGSSLAAADDP